ncbi:hypothetical protein [Robertkochia sediminum]|uniref:hypothetical protein n=1 Tax=Robertkochia sediminum TaxID=2785326 RepID=UPI0019337D6F|nr:hypothetical protein [Robertkochia sediminum]MBL7473367.1 hypothetical protein [Robertkochia sediminum]
MKMLIRCTSLAVALLFITTLSSCEVIKLKVDAARLIADGETEDFNDYATFEDQDNAGSLESYLATVKKGRVITWKGVSTSKGYKVNITKVMYEEGTNPFPDSLEVINYKGSWKGKLKKVVKVKPVRVTTGGEDCKYSLHFTISQDGKTITQPLVIDPKLRIMQ